MKSERTRYVTLPEYILYDPELSPSAKLLYADIAAHCHSCGYCWASNYYFAKRFGVTDRNIRRLLQQLQQADLISVQLEQNHQDWTKTRRAITLTQEDKTVLTKTSSIITKDNNISDGGAYTKSTPLSGENEAPPPWVPGYWLMAGPYGALAPDSGRGEEQ